ncbi:hypothetical protein [Paludisphaera rhizosphaerae]|uniref:hypothetical protein n=1 Tax=Paludisphaera rhizosphaerae TaxID=2711216 RepID=UPI0013E9B874|nr:hypothetical protein [Paludisphaera rhizosphaerae]
MTPWYDNLEPTPVDGLTCMVEVERVYGFDWDRFDEDDWSRLSQVCEGLPGAIKPGPSGLPGGLVYWFGDDEDVPPYLSASVEPPGLQVYGMLPEADWSAWDARFQAEATTLPTRASR